MSLLERMLRQQMRQQMLYGRRRRRPGLWGPAPRRRPYGLGSPYGWGRPRRRTHVRVGGCCLPIPLGVMSAGALGVRLASMRRRG